MKKNTVTTMNNNEEELHQIEFEDGNVPQINNQDNQDDDQPTPEDVYNRIVTFESILKNAWDLFQEEMKSMILSIETDIDNLRTEVSELKNSDPRIGSSVVIFPERLVGVVTCITRTQVHVKIDKEDLIVKKKKDEIKIID